MGNYRYGLGTNPQHSTWFSHIITIQNVGPIGSLKTLNMRQSRAAERIREINAARGPVVKEIVWGGAEVELELTKIELFDNTIFTTMGVESIYDIYSLDEVNFRFDIIEIQFKAGNDVTPKTRDVAPQAQRVITYEQCVPTAFSKNIDSDTPHIVEQMTCWVTSISIKSGSESLNYIT